MSQGQIEVDDLVLLGLPERAARTYLALLDGGPHSAEQVAKLSGAEESLVLESFGTLNDAGLVSLTDNGSTALPVRPGSGLDMLARRREADLLRARIAASAAYETFLHTMGGEPISHLIEVIPAASVAERVRQLERGVRTEVRGFDTPPYYAGDQANRIELDNLERGVRYRVIYATAAMESADYLADNLLPGVVAGEEARTLPQVPVKLILFDDECAVVAQTAPRAGADRSALLIRPCSLLEACRGLFEMSWRAALPFHLREGIDRYLQPNERRLLSLLAAGLGDDQAARALGISRRTLFRYLEGMMARTGAANRFQLALHAARNGWMEGSGG
jgi:DNA-binding CsgD family transcriptional regulator